MASTRRSPAGGLTLGTAERETSARELPANRTPPGASVRPTPGGRLRALQPDTTKRKDWPDIVAMAKTLVSLDVRTRKAWRQWLAKHHASSPGVWLVLSKRHTGAGTMSLDDVQREALCFGWIDSLA